MKFMAERYPPSTAQTPSSPGATRTAPSAEMRPYSSEGASLFSDGKCLPSNFGIGLYRLTFHKKSKRVTSRELHPGARAEAPMDQQFEHCTRRT